MFSHLRLGATTALMALGMTLALGLAPAAAKPVPPPAEYLSSGNCNVADLTVAAQDCFGNVIHSDPDDKSGINDSEDLLNKDKFNGVIGLFGYTGWDNLSRIEPGKSADGSIGQSLTLSVLAGVASGTWSVTAGAFDFYKEIVIVLKQGKTFSAYLYDVTKGGAPIPTGGSWTAKNFDQPGGLSHMTIYGGEICTEKYCGEDFNDDDNTGDVPLPAGGLLLLTGLAGLWLGRRRR